jgi:hypothetical protein
VPKVKSEKQYNSFVKGLVTEASPLTFPENAFLDGDNIVLKRDGSFVRRLGIDYEDGYSLTATGIDSTSLAWTKKDFYKWNLADGVASLGVVRVLNSLYFLDMAVTSPSSSLKNSGNAIILPLGNAQLETTVINGKLVLVASSLPFPIVLSYDSATDVVTASSVNIRVRDFWGVEDSLAVDERPTTLSNLHKYNLLNQGWPTAHITTVAYPSNADIWTLGKDTSDNFSKATLVKNSVDKAHAPMGKFILDAFSRGTSRLTETVLTGLPHDYEPGRLSTLATYAGRVFYAGVTSKTVLGDAKSPNYSGSIFFSKTMAATEDLGNCYQEADPTSEYISDIIDTDGGVINIVDANKIVKLVANKNSLIVFAENGIWAIYGSDSGGGFKATDYQLSKVTNIGVSNSTSIVVAGDTVIYWAKNGIFALAHEQTGGIQAQNLSLTTIQTFYDGIGSAARENAKGFYDQKENTVRWLYSESSDDEYNKELILDLSLQAFYTNTVAVNNVFIADYVEVPNYINNPIVEDVYVGSDKVLVGTNTVQIDSSEIANRASEFSFLVFTTTGNFTLAKYNNDTFVDWKIAEGGVDYSSYLVSGYELFGDMLRKKQVTYLMMMFERTEDGFSGTPLEATNPSSCKVQAQWNWTNTAASGKWGSEFQAYRYVRNYTPSGVGDTFNTGDRVITTKNKLRGSGKSLSLYIHSEAGKDMRVLGWAIPMTGNSAP